MAVAGIAAIAFAIVITSAEARQVQPVHLAVQVTDQTGAACPSADVGLSPPSGGSTITVKTDSRVEADLDLAPGSYVLSITSKGFYRWDKRIDMQGAFGQTIAATLVVQPIIDYVAVHVPLFPELLEHPPFTATIPLQNLEVLADLPAVDSSCFARSHGRQRKPKRCKTR